jgi:GntR family transcriptional regulator / MocR family aminotransferase
MWAPSARWRFRRCAWGTWYCRKGLTEPFAQRRSLDMRHSEVSTQAVMAEFMAAGHFQRHIRRMRRAALSRRNVLLADWPRDVAGIGAMPAIA